MQNDSISNSSSIAIREQTQKVVTPFLLWWWSFLGCRKCPCKWERELSCICTGEDDSFKLACEGDCATGSKTDSPRGLYGTSQRLASPGKQDFVPFSWSSPCVSAWSWVLWTAQGTLPWFTVGCNVSQVQCCSLLSDPQPTLKHFSCLRTSAWSLSSSPDLQYRGSYSNPVTNNA